MKTKSTFTNLGWDFTNEILNGEDDIWRLCTDGSVYPKLNREMLPGDFECPDGIEWQDLIYFADSWLNEPDEANSADITSNGIVSFEDFAIFANNWGVGASF